MSADQHELFPERAPAAGAAPGADATSAVPASSKPAPRPSRAATFTDGEPAAIGAGVYGPFRLDARPSGVYVLSFDDSDRRVNLLDSRSLDSLRSAVAALKAKGGVAPRALLLVSGKEGQFIAGADVTEFQRIESQQEAETKVKDAQALFQEIRDLPFPLVAAINGPCMGGGTELTLAFDYRLASDARGVSVAFPEVMLGILPGFGGTQRLPRRIGLLASLDLLLTGRSLDARRARRVGLIDDILPRERFNGRAAAWVEALLAGRKPRIKRLPLAQRVLQSLPPFRSYVLSQARKRVLAQSGGHYPAPLEILRVLESSWGKPLSQGLKVERKAVARLLFTAASIHLRRIFLLREAAKREPPALHARPVARAAVLGAGTMGGEIAYLLSSRDIHVRLRDIKPEPLLHSLSHAKKLFDKEASRGRLTKAELEQAMARIEPTLALDGLGRADVVIEAVVEDLGIKQGIFRELETLVPTTCVLATNTSSLSVRAIGKNCVHPERVVGMHFFNPVTRMPLVEVICHEGSDVVAVETVVALARRMGKTPVVVGDEPGFLVNRILMPYLGEAVALVERGTPIEAIDRALRGFGMPLGPCELLDEIGLDVARKVAHVLEEAFGERMPRTNLLDKLVSEGTLGKKSGRGFYTYVRGKRSIVNPVFARSPSKKDAEATAGPPPEEIVERLVDAMINEATMALEERVAFSADDVDLAMVMGTGFPPFRGGLLRHADAVGVSAIVERLQRRHHQGTPGGPCARLQWMALAGGRFHPDPPPEHGTGSS
ncbi:MAG: 3-hydroxyacyl-CoA dehydrogenase NAD-binding domain-containing protein [Candidatus Eisenbacteria bacterium]